MKTKGLISVSFLALTLVLAFDSGFALVWRLFALLLVMLVSAFLWTSLMGARGIEGSTGQLPRRLQVGDSFTESLTLVNKRFLPRLLLRMSGNSDLPGYSSAASINLGRGGSFKWQREVLCEHRGCYQLGPYTVSAGYPLGLFSHQSSVGEAQTMVVCPATVSLPYFELAPRHKSKIARSLLTSQSGVSVAGIREYVPGDSLRHVHWRSTARLGKLQVKMYDRDHSAATVRNAWVIVDMHPDTLSTDLRKENYYLTIASSLVKKCLEIGCPTGLMTSGERYTFPPRLGEQHLWGLLGYLGTARATVELPVDELLSSESERFDAESALIVVSQPANERLPSVLRDLRERSGLVIVVLVSSDGHRGRSRLVEALRLGGVEVYIVSYGDNPAVALDSRKPVYS